MQFCHMWYRIWLNNPEKYYNITDIYYNNNFARTPVENKYSNVDICKVYSIHKNKFENNFMKDNGVALRNLIQQSSDSEVMWEIPKGGKNNSGKYYQGQVNTLIKEETDIDCAIREFHEETSISSNKYTIFYDINPIIDSHVDNDVNYKTIYFIARLNKESHDFKPYIDYRNFSQITEIEQIKWVSISDLDFLTLSPTIHKRLKKLFIKVISTFKKNNKFKKL
ncbi:MAG: NUDIX domain-containing protein [Cetobacterium sp.]